MLRARPVIVDITEDVRVVAFESCARLRMNSYKVGIRTIDYERASDVLGRMPPDLNMRIPRAYSSPQTPKSKRQLDVDSENLIVAVMPTHTMSANRSSRTQNASF